MVSPEKIQEIAEHVKAFINKEIDELKKEQLKVQGQIVASDKLRGRIASILIIDGITKKLPENLELFVYDVKPVTNPKQIRNNFNGAAVRKSVLKQAFQTERDNLVSMGLRPAHIDFLEQGYVPRNVRGHPLDLTVDHIIEVAQGGKNSFDNLCIIPGYFNLYKATFTNTQVRTGLTEIIGIRPKPVNGIPVIAPIFKGGFRGSTMHGPEIRRRMENLLNMKLE